MEGALLFHFLEHAVQFSIEKYKSWDWWYFCHRLNFFNFFLMRIQTLKVEWAPLPARLHSPTSILRSHDSQNMTSQLIFRHCDQGICWMRSNCDSRCRLQGGCWQSFSFWRQHKTGFCLGFVCSVLHIKMGDLFLFPLWKFHQTFSAWWRAKGFKSKWLWEYLKACFFGKLSWVIQTEPGNCLAGRDLCCLARQRLLKPLPPAAAS